MFFGDDDDNAVEDTGVRHPSAAMAANATAISAAGLAYFKAEEAPSGAQDSSALDALISSCYHTGYSSQAFRYITAFCFLFLAAATAALGSKVCL